MTTLADPSWCDDGYLGADMGIVSPGRSWRVVRARVLRPSTHVAENARPDVVGAWSTHRCVRSSVGFAPVQFRLRIATRSCAYCKPKPSWISRADSDEIGRFDGPSLDPIPTVSQWGAAVLAITLLIAVL